jgi:hypothetical protein
MAYREGAAEHQVNHLSLRNIGSLTKSALPSSLRKQCVYTRKVMSGLVKSGLLVSKVQTDSGET